MYNQKNKSITTDRLVLRPFRPEDAQDVVQLCNNINLSKGLLRVPFPYAKQDYIDWQINHERDFDNDAVYVFAMTDKKTKQIYGAIELSNDQTNRNGLVGYWVGEEFWGKGYATESVIAIVNFAFDVKNYHRVYSFFFVDNPSSGKVLKKAGLKREGTLFGHILKDRQFRDITYCGIVNPNSKNTI